MEPVLLMVTVLSLLMAVGLAVVAWRLLRESRSRSLARVEALHALVSGDGTADDDEAAGDLDAPFEFPSERSAPLAATEREHTPLPAPAPVAAPARALAARAVEPAPEESWDLALRERRTETHHDAPAHVRVRAARVSRPAAEEHLFEEPEQRTPSHRWSALVAVALVMAVGLGGAYAAYSTDLIGALSRLVSSRTGAATTNAGEAPLLLLSLRHTNEAGGEFVVTGLVQNPSASPSLKGVVAVVYLFDREGRYFASGKASLDAPVLASGAEAPFVIKVSATQPIGRYRVGFRQEDGTVIAHVDRRGELPGGTTGDAIENTSPTATPVMRRSEG